MATGAGKSLLDIFVRIKLDGEKQLDAAFKKYEERAKKFDDSFKNLGKNSKKASKETSENILKISEAFEKVNKGVADFEKQLSKTSKNAKKELDGLVDSIDKVGKANERTSKSFSGMGDAAERESKRSSSALSGILDSLDKLEAKAKSLSKQTFTVNTELRGDREVTAGLDRIERAGNDLERDSIIITAEIRGDREVVAALERMDALAERVDGRTVRIEIEVTDVAEAVAEIERLQEILDRLDGRTVTVNVDVDMGAAISQIDYLEARLNSLDGKNVTVNVDVDTAAATANLVALEAEVAAVDANDINIDVDVDGAAAATAELVAFEGVTQAAGLTGGVFTRVLGQMRLQSAQLMATILLLTPALTVLAATITPLLGGISVLGSLAVGAAGGFGLLVGAAIPLAKGLEAVEKATTKVKDANTKLTAAEEQLQVALASGDEEAIAAARKDIETATKAVAEAEATLTTVTEQQGQAVADLYSKWQTLKSALAAAFEPAKQSLAEVGVQLLDLANQAVPALGTAATQVGSAFKSAMDQVLTSIQANEAATGSLQTILDGMAPIVENLTTAVGTFGTALINIFAEATPYAVALSEEIANVAQRFLEWTQSAEGVQQINDALALGQRILDETVPKVAELGAALLRLGEEHGAAAIDMVNGLVDGLTYLVEELNTTWDEIQPLIDALVTFGEALDTANSAVEGFAQDIHDTLFGVADDAEAAAAATGEGWASGLDSTLGSVQASAQGITDATTLALDGSAEAQEQAAVMISTYASGIASGASEAEAGAAAVKLAATTSLEGTPEAQEKAQVMISAYSSAIAAGASESEAAALAVKAAATASLDGTPEATAEGSSTGSAYATGIESASGSASSAGSSVAESAVSGASGQQGAMGQAGESTGDAYSQGVESGMIPAEAAGAEGAAKTAAATEGGLSSIPGTVEQIMSGIPPEVLLAWQNATAYAANATAEMTRVITHNLETIDNNVQVILGQATESIQTKMEEMAAAAQAGVDAVNAAFESGFSVSVSDYITPMIDEGIAEFTRFSSEGPTEIQVGVDAITESLNTLYTDSLASYITPMVDEIVAELERLASEAQTTVDTMATDLTTSFTTLGTDIGTAVTTMVTDVTTQLTDMSTQVITIITDMSTQLTTSLTDMSTQVVTTVTDMQTQVLQLITDLTTQVEELFTTMSTNVTTLFTDLVTELLRLTQQLYDEVTRIIGDMATWIEQRIGNMISAITSIWSSGTQFLISSSATAATSVVSNFGNMAVGVQTYVNQMIAAIQRLNAAMNSIGGMRAGGIIAPAIGRGLAPVGGLLGRAKGGVDENVEVQGGTGGVSTGLAPRVVYGEQREKVKEAYVVEGREDNLPYLAEAASWFNMQLVPGMARGGLSSQIGQTYAQVPHIPPPEPVDSGASQSTLSGTSGAAGAAGSGAKKPSRRQRRRQRRRDRRAQSRSTAPTGGSTAPTGGSAAPTGGSAAPSTGSSLGSTPAMGETGDTGAASPSQSAFPSNCGNLYPVATPTESGQVPYRDAALSQSGMVAAQAGVSADHVNAPADMTHPGTGENCGMPGQGSPPSLPYGSTGLGGPGTAPSSYDKCLPAHVTGFQTGGTTTDPTSGQAVPIDWMEVPLGYWSSGLGYAWYGDPALDWPTLYPPAGWDPSAWYYYQGSGAGSGATGGMADGGILKNGTRYFQGGGLNTWQLQAGLDAASAVVGSPYSYEHAGDDGGFDCSGLWQYIYTAVRDGAPTPDYRWWGTGAWAGGFPGGEGVPGPIPGAVNVYTDLSGWDGDGTHTSGDILDTPFEAIFSGVQTSSSAAGNDGIWSIGDPSSIGEWGPVTPDYSVDPSALMSEQVSSWWLCQAPVAPDIGTAPMYGPVEEWMTTLPGMTEPYLQEAGQYGIGTLSSGPAGGWGGTTRDWIISALEATGMNTDETSIAALEALIACESGGDQNAVSPDGALGLTQLMGETWSQFNIGGEVWDPIANIAASINYQLSRYGGLVDFCPYERGGYSTGAQMMLRGERGREVTLPLDDRQMAGVAQRALGIESLAISFDTGLSDLAEEVRAVKASVDHQTRALPGPIASAMDDRIAKNPTTHRSLGKYEEASAVREIYRGATR